MSTQLSMQKKQKYSFKIIKAMPSERKNKDDNQRLDEFHQISDKEREKNKRIEPESGLEHGLKRRRRSGGKHQMAACCSCKKRRKKCDGCYPVCSSCKRLGTECTMIYPPTGKEIKRDYLERLETSVRELESKLQRTSPEILNSSESMISNSPLSSVDGTASPMRYPPALNKHKDLVEDIGFISLSAAGDSYYIGETSAYSIAKVISSSINCYPSTPSSKRKNSISSPRFELPFRFPSIETATGLFLCYKKSVQCQYPFLDWKFAEKCFDIVMEEKKHDEVASFFIFMIFAIASQIQDSTNNNRHSSYTKSYYKKSFETVGGILASVNLYTVQAYLLMAVFSQKMPDGISGWQAIGLAIRTSVVLGLHRKSYQKRIGSVTNEYRYLEDLKSRIFWSAYGIERINGLVLGRPFSISDIDIDAPFPLETEETKVACHVVKLRRIQSNIYTFIYKPVQLFETAEDAESTRLEILLELNIWMDTFPYKENAASTFETNNWSLISYHNSILLLLRPVILEISKLKDKSPKRFLEWFKVFTESASAVCINYKNMHLKKRLSYTLLALHCCFVSGISFLYCIWLDCSLHVLKWKRQSLVYETIGACQTILYVFAERWESTSRFRDSFETLSNIVKSQIDSKEGDDSSSYTSMTEILNSGIFEDGSIGIDSYLTGKQYKDKFSHRNSATGETDSSSIGANNLDLDKFWESNDISSLWQFLDNTGDKYLRDIFNEMEDSMSILK